MDRFPKKPCRFCGLTGHFPYECRLNPKKIIKRNAPIRRSNKPLKRSPLKKVGKQTKQWLITRATWIRRNPPPIEGRYWECYLRIHPWCPVRIDIEHLTLDHVVARTRDPSKRFNQANLRPACGYCNDMKGSQSLEQVRANNE
jgi:5-methylcytosine-specific restriction endonuclease McrA